MRNFFNFLIRSWFFILFIVLLGVSLILLFSNNNYHQAAYINSANALSGRVYEAEAEVTDYFALRNANKQLADENAQLRNKIKDAYEISNKRFFIKEDTVYSLKYNYTAAKVINNSVNRRNNYITLNKGSLHGIRPKMAVIAPTGIVGVVKDVSQNYSTVLSLLHKAVKISAKLKKTDNFGSLEWDGNDPNYAYLKDISSYVKLTKGDTIITTSYSDMFPEGIMVGTVDRMEEKSSDAFHLIRVKLSTDFTALTYVYVVSDFTRTERDTLEAKTIKSVEKEGNGN